MFNKKADELFNRIDELEQLLEGIQGDLQNMLDEKEVDVQSLKFIIEDIKGVIR